MAGSSESYTLTDADLVWNRACAGVCDDARPGDIALASLFQLDGPAHNGGVLHALECLEPEALQAALDGFAYFGLSEPIAVLKRAATAASSLSERELDDGDADEALSAEYWVAAEGILEAFRQHYSAHAEQFASIRS